MPYLKVIKASAGSGKTFSLAGEYMALLFADHEKFRNILAVTFTNKATEEMKTRIIKEIYNLSSGSPTPYLRKLMAETGLDETYIRKKAGFLISVILHDYSKFSVCTIDSFFQKIIRSFTVELGLQSGYSIEIEIGPVLKDVVERLFHNLDSDNQLLEWLTGYAETLIDEGENWNFRKGIENLGNQLFREDFARLPEVSGGRLTDRRGILDFRKKMYSTIEKCTAEYSSIGKKAIQVMELYSLSPDDFSYKNQGVAGYLKKISDRNFTAPSVRAREALSGAEKNWYPKNSDKKDIIAEACNNGMLDLLNQAVDYFDTNERLFNTSTEVLKNLYNLGILSDLMINVTDYCNDNNVFILSEASSFIQRIIAGNDTPFIYEKAGQWYHHFMIDEFQDTSMLQWQNFKPLISNGLSQNFSSLLVGDVKQSIYRWRNSNWEILANGIEQEYNPEILKFGNLLENRRSGRNIVHFNNEFFRKASSLLQAQFDTESADNGPRFSRDIAAVYNDLAQVPVDTGMPEGSVTFRIFPDDLPASEYRDFICTRLMDELNRLLLSGYKASQIAVLTRTNPEAVKIAEHIISFKNSHPELPYSLEVISDEALLVSGSSCVRFIVSLLKHLVDPMDKTNNYHIITEYVNYIAPEAANEFWRVAEEVYPSWQKSLYDILPEGFLSFMSTAGKSSLSELVAGMINLFSLSRMQNELVYLLAFQDIVLDFTNRHSSDPLLFLDYWDETGKDKAITAPASQEAVRILTIHKAKGLEFDVVLVPFCNWKIISHKDIMWCSAKEFGEEGPGYFPVKFTTSLSKTFFSDYYFDEMKKQYVDNLNLLYVAFTRAKKELVVYCRDSKNEDGKISSISDVSQLSRAVVSGYGNGQDDNTTGLIDFKTCYDAANKVFLFGKISGNFNITNNSVDDSVLPADYHIDSCPNLSDKTSQAFDLQEKLRISFRNADLYFDQDTGRYTVPVTRGRVMHELFSNIRGREDIPRAVRRMFLQGKIDIDECDKMVDKLQRCLDDIQVFRWFTDEWKVLTEAEIVLPEGITRRPDRVMISGDRAIVVDYKFGLTTPAKDKAQVSQYLLLLREMGYKAEGYLWYVEPGRVIAVL